MKRSLAFSIAALASAAVAHADLTYVTTVKNSSAAAPKSSTHYVKGDKLKTDRATTATITDLDARTVTTISNTRKLYSVRTLGGPSAKVQKAAAAVSSTELHVTGRKETVNGYAAREIEVTANIDAPQAPRSANLQVVIDVWVSSAVPGIKELRAFQNKSRGAFSPVGGAAFGVQGALKRLEAKLAEMDGEPVRQIVKIRAGGRETVTSMTDFTGFSAAPIADSVFATPPGYRTAR
jgi:Domain of unknown function (DUF4412)